MGTVASIGPVWAQFPVPLTKWCPTTLSRKHPFPGLAFDWERDKGCGGCYFVIVLFRNLKLTYYPSPFTSFNRRQVLVQPLLANHFSPRVLGAKSENQNIFRSLNPSENGSTPLTTETSTMSILTRCLIALFVMSLLTFACTPKTATKVDANVPLVTYADVSPILLRSCAPCHYPDQDGGVLAFNTYPTAKKHLSKMLRRVQLPQDNHRFMPYELQKEALSAEEIEQLKNWARGGYRQG